MKFKNPYDRAVHVGSTSGHCFNFEPGQTAEVHPSLEAACFDARLALITESVAVDSVAAGPSDTERRALIESAVATVIAKGDPKDFTADARPRKSAIDALLPFKTTADEAGKAYIAVMTEQTGKAE